MKTVCDRNQCAGCMACINICPKNAITIEDSLSAYNAVIDESKCINCGNCYSVCQEKNPPNLTHPILWKQGWSKNVEIRNNSSSGGLASALEMDFVRNGGLVCSCVYQKGEFLFSLIENESDIKKFAGSKYVKSNPGTIYKIIKKKLKEGRKILFVGLPCQVAAVKKFTNNADNLYTIDLICHGTPSPQILEYFLKDFGLKLDCIQDIRFRVKMNFKLEHDHIRFTVPTVTDDYLMTFLNATSYTENCYHCKYAKLDRVGDITLGDSWGSKLDKKCQRQGVSLMLCQNDKGKELLEQTDIFLTDVDLHRAVEFNHQLKSPAIIPKEREVFFDAIRNGTKFKYAVLKCYPKRYIKNIVKSIIYKVNPQRGKGCSKTKESQT